MYDPTESVQPLVASTPGPPVRPSERPTSINRCRSASNPARSIERYASHFTPRYSPDGKWLAYLSMERAGFEADRQRLMLVGRSDGRTGGPSVEATKGWTLSVGSYIWCPDSKCVYGVEIG